MGIYFFTALGGDLTLFESHAWRKKLGRLYKSGMEKI